MEGGPLRDQRVHGGVLEHADRHLGGRGVAVDDATEHVGPRREGREVRDEVAEDAAEELVLVLGGELAKVLLGNAHADDAVDELGEAERREPRRAREVRVDALDDIAVAAAVVLHSDDVRLDAAHVLVGERGAADKVRLGAVVDVVEDRVREIGADNLEDGYDPGVVAREPRAG